MSDEDDTTIDETAGTDRTDGTDDGEGSEALRDAGKKALDAMKTKWQSERDARKERDAEIARLNTELAKRKPADGDKPADVDADAIRKQALAEARAEALQERVLDRIEARAAKLFADPEDARLQLGRKAKDFIDDGKVDTDAIDEALAELLKKKPHLAATATRFTGSADGGARKGSGKPAQITEQQLKTMSPDAIVAARAKGQLDDLMGVS